MRAKTNAKTIAAFFLTFIMVLGMIPCAELTAAAATYSTVRYGSTGQDVKTLQTMLNTVDNAKLTVDGKFGTSTQTAVKNFQKANNLTVDGVVGPSTWNVLSTKYAIKTSTLAIGSGKYSPGTSTVGSSYSISGAITSNNKITSVTVGIYKSNGKATSYVKTVTPNVKSYNISALASSMKFQSLAAGSYKFKVVAKDASTNTKTLVNNSFTVNAKSKLTIGSGKYAPGTYYAGSSYSISGTITSNNKITSVTVGVYKSNGTATSYVKTVAPNAKSYNISAVASSIKFESLAAGSYKLKVVAKDASGTSKTLVNNSFTVKAKSTLAIGSGKYAPGTYTVGSSYSISGAITSNYNITSVTVGVYKSDGTATSYVKTATPNAKSYNISAVDSSIKFGSLAVGSYKFKVVAKDASGTTKTLVNNAFTVKATTKLETFKSNALANWVKPVRATCLTVPGTGRAFGASRSSGTRAHAGIDYYVRGGSGTPVYAMQSGKVIEYIANFYYGTSCVAIQHADGSIARYAEISTSLGVGKTVTKGQQIGKIVANTLDGGTMLHLELYLGTASGSLTNRTNKTYDYASGTKYQRRRDLVNPEFLLKITRTK